MTFRDQPPMLGLTPTTPQTQFVVSVWEHIDRTPLMNAGRGAGKTTALLILAQMLEEVADANPEDFPRMEDRLTMAGQAAGPDEYPEGYYRERARSYLRGTLAPWLFRRFWGSQTTQTWDDLSPDDQAYYEHEADAVRRAVARNGFKACGSCSHVHTEADICRAPGIDGGPCVCKEN